MQLVHRDLAGEGNHLIACNWGSTNKRIESNKNIIHFFCYHTTNFFGCLAKAYLILAKAPFHHRGPMPLFWPYLSVEPSTSFIMGAVVVCVCVGEGGFKYRLAVACRQKAQPCFHSPPHTALSSPCFCPLKVRHLTFNFTPFACRWLKKDRDVL